MPWALAGVVTGAVVSTATAAAATKAIFIIGASSLLDTEIQQGRARKVSFPFRCKVLQMRSADRGSGDPALSRTPHGLVAGVRGCTLAPKSNCDSRNCHPVFTAPLSKRR